MLMNVAPMMYVVLMSMNAALITMKTVYPIATLKNRLIELEKKLVVLE